MTIRATQAELPEQRNYLQHWSGAASGVPVSIWYSAPTVSTIVTKRRKLWMKRSRGFNGAVGS
jgi:hypothetical protein